MILRSPKNHQITVRNTHQEAKRPDLAYSAALGSLLVVLAMALTGQAADDNALLLSPPDNAPNAAQVAPIASEPAPIPDSVSSSRPLQSSHQQGESIVVASAPSERVLRWRNPTVPTRAALRQVRNPSPIVLANHDYSTARQSSRVVHANQVEPLDDPFDDQASETSSQDEGELQLTLPRSSEELRLSLRQDLAAPNQPNDLPAPPSFDEPRVDPAPLDTGLRGNTPGDSGAPCRDVFNGRNTCDERAACTAGVARLQEERLAGFDRSFLNITPAFDSRGAEIGSESRSWHDRRGNVLARGRLLDYRDGKVIVEESNGEQVSIPEHNLSAVDLSFITAWWSLPPECRLSDEMFAHYEQYEVRPWCEVTYFTWKASALCHKPLYFEDVSLERYGHATGPIRQPLLSGAHFFLNVAILPYRMGMNPPQECQYALGYYRVGNCSPWMIHAFPLSPRGALAQAAVATGLPFIIP